MAIKNDIKKYTDNRVKKVLMVVSSINITGGVSNKIMDVYRNIDKSKVQFDFFIHIETEKNFEKEINSLGGNVFYIGLIRNVGIIKYLKGLYKIIKNGNYDIVHSHIGFNSGIVLFLARLAGVKIRIAHARGAIEKQGLKSILIPIMKKITKINANYLLTSSIKSGKINFGSNKFKVIPNSLNIDRFLTARKDRELMKKIGINNNMLVLGHVGRFSLEKNHDFLLLIAKKLKEKSLIFKLVLVGDGKLRNDFENKVSNLGLKEYFYFAGDQSKVEKYYPLFNVLLFPSLHEGFGNVAIEAQVANTMVIASKGVPKEVDLGLNLVEFISLENLYGWIDSISNIDIYNPHKVSTNEINNALISRELDINSTLKKYYQIYKIET